MYYEFPVIRHLDDVLPHIQDCPEIIVIPRDGFTVVNYVVHIPGMFGSDMGDLSLTNRIRRECRGLIFDSNGYLVSRPYHKFFNVGEQEETQEHLVADLLSKSHYQYLEKLDGSMIRPIRLGDRIRMATKMGFTDVSAQVDLYLRINPRGQQIIDFCYELMQDGLTPIFEWCSRNQRIVVDYPTDSLVLTAVRDNIEGYYLDLDVTLTHYGYDIPTVKSLYNNHTPFKDVAAAIRGNTIFKEGIVIRLSTGHMLKMKTDWYCNLHRSKDIASRTHDVVQCILTDTVDDLKANLAAEDRVRVEDLERRINAYVMKMVVDANKFVIDNRQIYGDDKKSFAFRLREHTGFSSDFTSVLFAIWDGKDAFDLVRKYVQNRTNSMSSCAKFMEDNVI